MKNVESYQAKLNGDIMLNANESSENLDIAILKEIQQAITDIPFNRYPDTAHHELIQAYANVIKMDEHNILAGNGSDEMLGLMIGYFLGKDKKLYTLSPDFSMYDYYASMHEATMVKFPCEPDGSFDINAFIQMGKQQKVDMIVFSNPNNPTGHLVKKQDLQSIVTAFANIPVIIDEAYGEFAQESMLSELNTYENLYVTRTLSKAYGLAGARLGFLISNERAIRTLTPFVVPYNISSIAQKVGSIVLKHAKAFEKSIEETKQRRDAFYNQVKDLQRVTFYPSQANYLYGRCNQKDKLLQAFEKQGIIIRDYAGTDSFRITIGTTEETALLLQVLLAFEKEE